MATNGSPLPADWWRGTQFDQGGQFVAPAFTGSMQTPAWAQAALAQGNAPGGVAQQQMTYSPVNRADPVFQAYGQGGRPGDMFNGQTAQFELNPAMRQAYGLNNGRVYLQYTQDPKTGQYIASPMNASIGEAEQNQATGAGLAQGAKFVIPRALAMIAGAEGASSMMGAAPAGSTGVAGAGGELGGSGSSVGGSLGGVGGGVSDTGAFGAAGGGGALSGGGGASAADVGYMGPGSAGAGATGEVGAAAPEASGSLLSQLTPQQIASAVQQYGPTAIKALGMIAASTAAQHAANSQNASGSSSNAAGVAPWNYQQQPIAPGSAFGGGMFGQQQGNPIGMQAPQAISPQQRAAWSQQFLTGDPTGGMRGYQFGNMGGPGKQPQMMPPQQVQSPQNPYMPQGFGGMMGGPSQQALQQYQQQLFQQHSGPGGFYGFQAPVAQQMAQMPSSPLYNNNGPQMPQVPQYMPRANIQPGMVSQPVSGGSTPQQWWGNLPSGLFGRVT